MKVRRLRSGAELKNFREFLGYTQAEMAALLEENLRTYQNLEQERRRFRIYLFEREPVTVAEAETEKKEEKIENNT